MESKREQVIKAMKVYMAASRDGTITIGRSTAESILKVLEDQEQTVHECKCGDTNEEVLEKIERQDAVLAEFIEMCMTFMSLQMTYNMQNVSIMQDKGEFEELPEMSQTMVEAGLEAMENFVNRLVGTMENVIKKRLKVKDVDIEELKRMFKGSTERTDN